MQPEPGQHVLLDLRREALARSSVRVCEAAPEPEEELSSDTMMSRISELRRRDVTPKRATTGKGSELLTAEEKAAMRETLDERNRARSGKVNGENEVLAKIAEMPKPDRIMAERIHAIVKANATSLTPKTWYGMPAYAKDGKVICFFQSGAKFKARYATFGFQQDAHLDDGDMWATSFALNRLTPAVEDKIGKLVRKASN